MNKIKVFYDGSCALCRREIELYKKIDRKNKVDWLDLNHAQNILDHHHITTEAALKELHVIGVDGGVHLGVDSFFVIWRELPVFKWLVPLAQLKPCKFILERLYSIFAKWRYRRMTNNECKSCQPDDQG